MCRIARSHCCLAHYSFSKLMLGLGSFNHVQRHRHMYTHMTNTYLQNDISQVSPKFNFTRFPWLAPSIIMALSLSTHQRFLPIPLPFRPSTAVSLCAIQGPLSKWSQKPETGSPLGLIPLLAPLTRLIQSYIAFTSEVT